MAVPDGLPRPGFLSNSKQKTQKTAQHQGIGRVPQTPEWKRQLSIQGDHESTRGYSIEESIARRTLETAELPTKATTGACQEEPRARRDSERIEETP